jgi:hypothetical protein
MRQVNTTDAPGRRLLGMAGAPASIGSVMVVLTAVLELDVEGSVTGARFRTLIVRPPVSIETISARICLVPATGTPRSAVVCAPIAIARVPPSRNPEANRLDRPRFMAAPSPPFRMAATFDHTSNEGA